MNRTLARSIVALCAMGGLTAACAVQTSNDDAKKEATGNTAQADSTCTQFMSPAATYTYVNEAPPFCDSLVQNEQSGSGTYGTSSCQFFGVEWDGTTINSNGTFSVAVVPRNAIGDQTTCLNTTVNLIIYGFENSVNPSIYGTPGWIPLQFFQGGSWVTTLTEQGQWSGVSCTFGEGINAVSAKFSDAVPSPGYGDLPRYLDFRVYSQAYTLTTVKGTPSYSYLPVLVSFAPQICME